MPQSASHRRPEFRFNASTIYSILGFLVLAAVVYALIKPVVHGSILKSDVKVLEKEKVALEQEKARLENRTAWLRSPEGAAELARERGMVGPNEQSLRFTPPKPPQTADAEEEKASGFSEMLIAILSIGAVAFLCGVGLLIYRRRARLAKRPVGALTPRSELRKRRRPAHEG